MSCRSPEKFDDPPVAVAFAAVKVIQLVIVKSQNGQELKFAAGRFRVNHLALPGRLPATIHGKVQLPDRPDERAPACWTGVPPTRVDAPRAPAAIDPVNVNSVDVEVD
jgi:hypothetical protein